MSFNCDIIEALSEERKRGILSSPTQIKCNGRAYYVSNNGSDDNDGLSEETPIKTLKKACEIKIERGDVLFLERGSLFREKLTLTSEGVTVSAYGSGEKPCIYGSSLNYAKPSFWQTTDYKNLYRCSMQFKCDVGLIVFDHGQAYSNKQLVGNFGFTGNLCELKSDLDMYYDEQDGSLYLYSDNKNPASRYSDIEICEGEHIIFIGANDITIDNLCIKYGSAHGIAGDSKNGLCVQNCELGWIGGMLQYYRNGKPVRFGNAIEIYASVDGYKMLNNYIYQVYDAALTHQYFQTSKNKMIMSNILYEGNLIEYCTYSLEYALAPQDGAEFIMRNVVIRNNIMRYAGYGFGSQRPDKDTPAHIKSWDTNNRSDNFIIENNIFDRSAYMVVHIAAENEEDLPLIDGNVYVQSRDGQLGRYGKVPTQVRYFKDEENFFSFDKNAEVILL